MNRALHKLNGLLCLSLAVAIILTSAVAAAESNLAIVGATRMKVYASASLSGASAALPKYTVVSVESVKGAVARITLNGITGYAKANDLRLVKDIAVPAVVSERVNVYAAPSTSSKSAALAEGTKLNVVAVAGGCAMVELNGVIGYTFLSHLAAAETGSQTAEPTKAPASNVVYGELSAVVVGKVKVYASASEKSKYLGSMNVGTYVTVHAYNPTWAYIELGGHFGFCKVTSLRPSERPTAAPITTPTPMPTPTPTPTPAPAPTQSPTPSPAPKPVSTDGIFADAGTTNEQKIYAFIVSSMGYSPAAACGILANMKAESGFRPNAVSSGGGYTGLCQWSASRFAAITKWCEDKGLDPMSLEGQLKYLEYELKNVSTKYGKALSEIENTAQGAYDAGYYFCYNYERPSDKAAKSDKRGSAARDTYWAKYGN